MPDKIIKQFSDVAIYSHTDKTAVSVRDGVLEYLGSELGLEPEDKVYTVYRSPATIANVYPLMNGIPLTDEHISIDDPAPDTGSKVNDGLMIDMIDEPVHATIAIKNNLTLNDEAVSMLDAKRQLSLGYKAELVPHQQYDFEQINIMPHHLAAVEAGRCGPLCSFLDRKPPEPENINMAELDKAFLDADGVVSLEQIMGMVTALPEAFRKIPVDDLPKVVPALQDMMSYATEQGAVEQEEAMDEEVEVKDEEKDEEEKPSFSDADFKDALAKAVKEGVSTHVKVLDKARELLPESYVFTDKSANDIMRDALKENTVEEFTDSELPAAFKALKAQGAVYKNFGDQGLDDNGLESRITAELEGK